MSIRKRESGFFCGYASVLLESTDFDLYIAKSEFSKTVGFENQTRRKKR